MQDRGVARWRATLLLLGTIVGAGIFGVPAMIGVWGVIPATIAFAVITGAILIAHLYYAEAIIANQDHAHLAGQAAYWLGRPARNIGGIIQTLQIIGGNLAYLILGGGFLYVLSRAVGIDLPLIAWQVLFWVVGSVLVFCGLKAVSRAESFLTWALIGVIVLIVAIFVRRADFSLIPLIPARFAGLEPYGIILFSVLGVTAMPEVAKLVKYRREDMRKAVIRSTLFAAALTYAYGVSAWLASGGTLSRDPSDVVRFLPSVLTFVFPLFGLLAVMTSFISSGLDLSGMLHGDFHISKRLAHSVSLAVPLILLFVTSRDFLATVGIVGSVFGASLAILVTLMGWKALRARRSRTEGWVRVLQSPALPVIVILFFVLGGLAWILTGR